MFLTSLIRVSLALLLGPLLTPETRADVYYYEDAEGVLHLADEPPEAQKFQVLHLNIEQKFRAAISQFSRPELKELIRDLSSTHGLEAALVEAIVRAESAYDPKAVSYKGARGLMQLMPATAQSLGVSNIEDPQENLSAGIRHLRALLVKYNGDLELSAAAYNAGAGAVSKYGGIPPYPETVDYVKKVRKYYEELKAGVPLTAGSYVNSPAILAP